MHRTVCLLVLIALLHTATAAWGEVGFRLQLPEHYPAELYVDDDAAPGGNGSQARPFRTIEEAIDFARLPMGSLDKRFATRINVAPGTYPESIDISEWPGQAVDTLLTIEGTSPDEVVLRPSDDHPEAGKAYFQINGKSAFAVRNLTFTGAVPGPLPGTGTLMTGSAHTRAPEIRSTDWLVENCVFRDGQGKGFTISFVDYYTVRNVKAYNLEDTGMVINGRRILLEDVEIYNTNTARRAGFGNGGMTLLVSDIVMRRIHIRDIPAGFGLRQDHAGEAMLIEDSIFERCEQAGVRLETAKGPVTIRNSVIRDNGEVGLYSDTGELTLTNTLIAGNPIAIRLQTGMRHNATRCVPPGYGCVGTMIDLTGTSITNKLPLYGVERMIVLGSTLMSDGPDGQILTINTDDAFWTPRIKDLWLGINNTYWSQNPASAFSTLGGGTTDLPGWQAFTGSDQTSQFTPPATAASPVGATPKLRFDRDRLIATSLAGSYAVNVDAPAGMPWAIRSTRDWLTVSPSQGVGPATVQVTMAEHTGSIRRHATLALASRDSVWDLMIVQEASALVEPVLPPSDLSVVEVGENSVTVTWSPSPSDSSRVYSYGLNFREPGGQWQLVPETKDTTAIIEGLSPGTDYEVRVATIGLDSVSPLDSTLVRFTTAGYRDPCEIINNAGFEQDTAQWTTRKLQITDNAHSGDKAGLLTWEGPGQWQSVSQNIKAGVIANGPGRYIASAWVKPVAGRGNYKLEMTLKNALGERYVRMQPVDPTQWEQAGEHGWKQWVSAEDGWTKIEGYFDVEWGDTLWDLGFRVQGGGNTVPFYVDDVTLKKVGCETAPK